MILRAATIALLAATPALAADRSFDVGSFDRIAAAGSADVTVTTGKAISVRATGDEAALDRLDIRVEDGALKIGTKKRPGMGWTRGKSRVFVTVPMLRGADVSGSGNLSVDRIKTADFTASVAGSGALTLASLAATTSRFSVAGSGNVSAAGTSGDTRASVSGSGNLAIPDLKSATLNASVSGSGSVDAFASTSARVSVAGSGDVRIRGGARCQVSKVGSGQVDCG